jgi:hypothetical protein
MEIGKGRKKAQMWLSDPRQWRRAASLSDESPKVLKLVLLPSRYSHRHVCLDGFMPTNSIMTQVPSANVDLKQHKERKKASGAIGG